MSPSQPRRDRRRSWRIPIASPRWLGILIAAAAITAGGCGSDNPDPEGDEAIATVLAYQQALQDLDGEAACDVLAPDLQRSLGAAARNPTDCATALISTKVLADQRGREFAIFELADANVDEASVTLDEANATVALPQATVHLERSADIGWEITGIE